MARHILTAALFGAAALAVAAPASAQSFLPTFSSDGDWLVRLRGIAVLPNEDVDSTNTPGLDVSIDDSVVPELDISYFFTPNIAAELILGTTPHDVTGKGAIIPGANVGSVWLLPPTLTLQYHVTQLGDWTGNEALSKVKPYVGAGLNYTIFYNEDAGQFASVNYDNAFGYALQAGVDFELSEGIYLNVDAKYIFLDTDVTVNNAIRANVDINPLIIGVGLGARF